MNVPLQISTPAVHRAAALAAAFRADDADTWCSVLANEQTGEFGSPYESFCAMTALVTALVNSVSDLVDKDPAAVLSEHAQAVAGLALDEGL